MAGVTTIAIMLGLVSIMCILLYNLNEELFGMVGCLAGIFFCIFSFMAISGKLFDILTLLGV